MRRLLLLLAAAAAAFAVWRLWSSRRAASEPITFDWDVPPPPPTPPPAPPPAAEPAAESSPVEAGAETPADRERESRADAVTKFEQATDEESRERSEAAERLRDDPLPDPE